MNEGVKLLGGAVVSRVDFRLPDVSYQTRGGAGEFSSLAPLGRTRAKSRRQKAECKERQKGDSEKAE